jgi:predicted extracellular nuclease
MRRPIVLLAVLSCCLLTSRVRAQVSLTTLGTPYTQPFDTLTTSGTANPWTDNSTLAGWYAQFSATPANPTTYRADSGGSNTGAIYSWGVAGVNPLTERAFGMLSSGTPVTVLTAVRFVNNTGSTITSLNISYNGEQWRDGGAVTPVAQTTFFEYQVANAGTITDANTPSTGWTSFSSLDFTSPTFTNTGAGAALDGNNASNRTAKSATLTVTVNPGQEVWLRWRDINDAGNDHGLGVDDLSVTPQGSPNAPVVPSCPASLATVFGTAASAGVSASDSDGTVTSAAITSITPSDPGTITLTGFTPAGGVGGTANATLDVSNTTPVGSYNVTIQWANNDISPQTATCAVAVSVTAITKIHDVQGNGAATPIPSTTVTVEGVVTANVQGTGRLRGFFLQEEDVDVDADLNNTSEGIFIFCNTCPTPVAEGQRVRATGVVSEFNNMTEITATTAGSVVVTGAGNHLAEVTPAPIDLPVVGVVNDFYETREGMLVTFVDTLTVSEYFEMARFGHMELFEGGRPRQFTELSPPSVAGYTAHLDNLDRRRVILDDDNNRQNAFLPAFGGPANGSQSVFHPQANGGFSVGIQGTDFFRGGDLVNGLTGVLHWSFPGTGADTWRIRPTAATPVTFTVANPRPATPPAVGGAIKAVSMNLLNYFTTIDTTASTSSGPCGPSMTDDCRGADSVAELNRQRERAAVVICGLNADVLGLMELENTTASGTITDLLGAVNALCGGANDYDFVDTGGTLSTDAIRVALIYRSGTLSPVGPPIVDLDPVHNRPPTAQTFDVSDPANPAFGERFTVIANHFKSKGCPGTGPDADAGDGAGCFNGARTDQANRLLTWTNGTVVPAAGDPDVLLLGDFNSYAEEDPITTLEAGGFVDLESALLGPDAYSYLFDGQLGHLDYAFASASLASQIAGAGAWHINADEVPLFDYNDEVFDSPGEANFEEKPDGSALVPSRVVFQPASPVRASDHDPVLVGLFESGNCFAVTPCRAVDTRSGPPLQNGVPQDFALKGVCGIPSTAKTVAVNITVVLPTGAGDLAVWPSDAAPPAFSILPFPAGAIRGLFSIVSLSSDAAGEVSVQPSVAGNGTVHITMDVMGYFN